MPGWLAALLVAAVLLIIAGILGLIGYRVLKKGIPPLPTESIDSLKRDYRAIKGIGKRRTPHEHPDDCKGPGAEGARRTRQRTRRHRRQVERAQARAGPRQAGHGAYEKNPLPFIIGGVAVAVVAVGLSPGRSSATTTDRSLAAHSALSGLARFARRCVSGGG